MSSESLLIHPQHLKWGNPWLLLTLSWLEVRSRDKKKTKKDDRVVYLKTHTRAGGVGASPSHGFGLSQGDPLYTFETSSVKIVSTPAVLHKLKK